MKVFVMTLILITFTGCGTLSALFNDSFNRCERHCVKYGKGMNFESRVGDKEVSGGCHCDSSQPDRVSVDTTSTNDDEESKITPAMNE